MENRRFDPRGFGSLTTREEGFNNPISSNRTAVKILLSGNRGEPRMLSAHCSRVRDSGLFGGLDWTWHFSSYLVTTFVVEFFQFFFFSFLSSFMREEWNDCMFAATEVITEVFCGIV